MPAWLASTGQYVVVIFLVMHRSILTIHESFVEMEILELLIVIVPWVLVTLLMVCFFIKEHQIRLKSIAFVGIILYFLSPLWLWGIFSLIPSEILTTFFFVWVVFWILFWLVFSFVGAYSSGVKEGYKAAEDLQPKTIEIRDTWPSHIYHTSTTIFLLLLVVLFFPWFIMYRLGKWKGRKKGWALDKKLKEENAERVRLSEQKKYTYEYYDNPNDHSPNAYGYCGTDIEDKEFMKATKRLTRVKVDKMKRRILFLFSMLAIIGVAIWLVTWLATHPRKDLELVARWGPPLKEYFGDSPDYNPKINNSQQISYCIYYVWDDKRQPLPWWIVARMYDGNWRVIEAVGTDDYNFQSPHNKLFTEKWINGGFRRVKRTRVQKIQHIVFGTEHYFRKERLALKKTQKLIEIQEDFETKGLDLFDSMQDYLSNNSELASFFPPVRNYYDDQLKQILNESR